MKKAIAAILSIAAIVLPLSAIAQTAAQANKDALNNIIVSGTGLAAETLVKIYYPQVFGTKNFTTSGACNILTVPKSSSFHYVDYIRIGTVQLNLSNFVLPALSGAPCLTGGVPNPAYSWRTQGMYRYAQDNNKLFILGATGQVTLTNDVAKFRLGKVDRCGRISIKNSEKWPIAGLNLDGFFSYAVGGSYAPDIRIPTTVTTALPICVKGILYRAL